MRKFTVALAVLLLWLTAHAAEPKALWRYLDLQEIDNVSALPDFIQDQLGVKTPGFDGVADKGAPFNATDLIDSSIPRRRLLAAGHTGSTWLVAIEQGGRGYNVHVYLFSGGILRDQWTLMDRPKSLREVIALLPEHGD